MMHADHWGLDFAPFSDEDRPDTFVPTRSAALAVSRLRYSLGREMGASGLFGAAGTGKSRIGRMLVGEFADAGWLTAYLAGPRGLARDILHRFDPAEAAVLDPSSAGLEELEQLLTRRAAEGQPALLAVDDVQAARSTDFLEMLRTLLNIRHDGRPALSLLLVGQPAMARRLAEASGFDGQLAARVMLEPMSDEEARIYILSRLKAAGSRQGIFTRKAADRVVEVAQGNPRQVNRLCEMALVVAYGLGESRVAPEHIDMAAADLDLLPGPDTPFFPWPHIEPAAPPEARPEPPQEEDILASLPAGE